MSNNKSHLQPDRTFDTTANVAVSSRLSLATIKRISSASKVINDSPKSREDSSSSSPVWKHKLDFLLDMILGLDLLLVFLLSSMLTFFLEQAVAKSSNNEWISFFSESKPAIATLGAFYSFALVFRTNICYARWWEGRTMWGSLTINAIRITQQCRLWIEDDALVDRLHCMAITYAYACKAQLREHALNDIEEDGSNLVLRGVLSQTELDVICNQNAWQPFYCIDVMRAVMNEGLKLNKKDEHPDWRKNSAHQAMENTICNLANAFGGCMKVKSTGLPVAYDDILNSMGAIFFIAAVLAWAPGSGYYNPIIVLVAYIIVKMIIGVGNDMEDPFGHDESDLPLEKYCHTIEKQINAIDERALSICYNLAYGPLDGKMVEGCENTKNSTDIEYGVSERTPLVNGK